MSPDCNWARIVEVDGGFVRPGDASHASPDTRECGALASLRSSSGEVEDDECEHDDSSIPAATPTTAAVANTTVQRGCRRNSNHANAPPAPDSASGAVSHPSLCPATPNAYKYTVATASTATSRTSLLAHPDGVRQRTCVRPSMSTPVIPDADDRRSCCGMYLLASDGLIEGHEGPGRVDGIRLLSCGEGAQITLGCSGTSSRPDYPAGGPVPRGWRSPRVPIGCKSSLQRRPCQPAGGTIGSPSRAAGRGGLSIRSFRRRTAVRLTG